MTGEQQIKALIRKRWMRTFKKAIYAIIAFFIVRYYFVNIVAAENPLLVSMFYTIAGKESTNLIVGILRSLLAAAIFLAFPAIVFLWFVLSAWYNPKERFENEKKALATQAKMLYDQRENEAKYQERKFQKNFNKFYEDNGEKAQQSFDRAFNGGSIGASSGVSAEIEKAKGLFFLGDDFTLSELKKARNDVIKRYASDNTHDASDDKKMAQIDKAYKLLQEYAKKG